MNAALDFLSSKLPIHGLAAYSIRAAGVGNAVASQCLSKSLYPNSAQEMLTRVVQEGRTVFSCEGRAANFCWTFEAHQVFVAVRADGLALALLMENNVSVQLSSVRNVLEGFLELQEA